MSPSASSRTRSGRQRGREAPPRHALGERWLTFVTRALLGPSMSPPSASPGEARLLRLGAPPKKPAECFCKVADLWQEIRKEATADSVRYSVEASRRGCCLNNRAARPSSPIPNPVSSQDAEPALASFLSSAILAHRCEPQSPLTLSFSPPPSQAGFPPGRVSSSPPSFLCGSSLERCVAFLLANKLGNATLLSTQASAPLRLLVCMCAIAWCLPFFYF